MSEPANVPVYAISEAGLDAIDKALRESSIVPNGADAPMLRAKALGYVIAARENPPLAEPSIAGADHATAVQQREFLMRQVESLVQRLAGSHVAAGLIAMPGAAIFCDQELLKVNAGMGAIFQANQPSPTPKENKHGPDNGTGEAGHDTAAGMPGAGAEVRHDHGGGGD